MGRILAPRPKPPPHYPLQAVRSATTVRVGGGRAREAVRKRFEALGKPMSDPDASAYVRAIVRALTPDAFVESRELPYAELTPVMSDIYGVRNCDGDWYVKLYFVRADLVVISCHEPEGTMLRADGVRIGRPRK